jgi:hypothetical protein
MHRDLVIDRDNDRYVERVIDPKTGAVVHECEEILTEIVQATRSRLSEARPADGLKAAEMLAKMCGWNEPERVNVQSIEVKSPSPICGSLTNTASIGEFSERHNAEKPLTGDGFSEQGFWISAPNTAAGK